MTDVLERCRAGLAALLKSLPQFKGRTRLTRSLNRFFLKCSCRPIVLAKMRHGFSMLLDLRSETELYAYYSGTYQDHLIRTCMRLIDRQSSVLDIGAHVGFFSLALAKGTEHFSGKIYAFEPVLANFRRLQENIEFNRAASNIQAFPFGLSDNSGAAEITLREDFVAGSETGNAALATNETFDAGFPREKIKLEKLDDICHQQIIADIDLIKVDIEGHEDSFLRGCRTLVTKTRPIILTEISKAFYRARGVSLEDSLRPAIPENYKMLRSLDRQAKHWVAFCNCDECKELDDVLLIPNEKLKHVESILKAG